MYGKFLVTRGDSTKLFEWAEKPLDKVACFVAVSVIVA